MEKESPWVAFFVFCVLNFYSYHVKEQIVAVFEELKFGHLWL